jgi:hypothetical protein
LAAAKLGGGILAAIPASDAAQPQRRQLHRRQ